jgi:hypothetical protein
MMADTKPTKDPTDELAEVSAKILENSRLLLNVWADTVRAALATGDFGPLRELLAAHDKAEAILSKTN